MTLTSRNPLGLNSYCMNLYFFPTKCRLLRPFQHFLLLKDLPCFRLLLLVLLHVSSATYSADNALSALATFLFLRTGGLGGDGEEFVEESDSGLTSSSCVST